MKAISRAADRPIQWRGAEAVVKPLQGDNASRTPTTS